MALPSVVKLSQETELEVVAGTYALPVWLWGLRYLEGARYKIIMILRDDDRDGHVLAPGAGYISMTHAATLTRETYPNCRILTPDQIGSHYCAPHDPTERAVPILLRRPISSEKLTVVHPYTRHEWKNCAGMLLSLKGRNRFVLVGQAGEVCPPPGWASLAAASFDEQAAAVIGCDIFAGLLSSWTNLAAIFQKRQIIVSFTDDVPLKNPNGRILVRPSMSLLADTYAEMEQ